MTTTGLTVLLMLLAGFGLGLVFFGGLRLTTHYLVKASNPWPLAIASFVIRAALFLVMLLWLGQGQWQRLALLLAGFIIARFVLAGSVALHTSRQGTKAGGRGSHGT